MRLQDDKAYIMSLLTVLAGSNRDSQFVVKVLDGRFTENEYSVPQLQIRRKEGKK